MLETPVETDLSEDMEQRDADFYAFVQEYTWVKNFTPVFRSTEMDLIRNGQRNQSNFSAIRNVRCFMETICLPEEHVQPGQNVLLRTGFGIIDI